MNTHYYHLCAVNDWRRIVGEHFVALESSGLVDELDSIKVGVVGETHEREAACAFVTHWFPKAEIVAEAGAGWEQITQFPLWFEAQGGAVGRVLYAHTKGVWNHNDPNERWRKAMTKWLITEWRTAVALLDDDRDVVGCHQLEEAVWPYEVPHWLGIGGARHISEMLNRETDGEYPFDPDGSEWADEPRPIRQAIHFSGNFWWTTMDWIRELPLPSLKDRFQAEQWVGCIKQPRVVNLQPGNPFQVYAEKETPS